jgi:hypothetical protein
LTNRFYSLGPFCRGNGITYPQPRVSGIAILVLGALSSLVAGCLKPSDALTDVSFACESDPTPSRIGLNTFTVTLTARNGERLTAAQVTLEGVMSHPGMSPVFSEAKEIAPGRYQGTLELNMRGDWTILSHITLSGGRSFERQFGIRNLQAT